MPMVIKASLKRRSSPGSSQGQGDVLLPYVHADAPSIPLPPRRFCCWPARFCFCWLDIFHLLLVYCSIWKGTAAVVDLRALTREGGEAEGWREEQSSASGEGQREAEQALGRRQNSSGRE
jgi:hypothetical protein